MRKRRIPSSLVWLAALVVLAIGTAIVSGAVLYMQTRQQAHTQANAIARGDWQRGKVAIQRYGCGSCHVIPGIHGANGQVGPDLTTLPTRSELAGKFPNDPDALKRWIMHPQALDPGVGMPEMGVSEADARDMAAYLYSQY